MTYDNTDERGEDAVARQRGGSERPQHVDTCRVYNCYGCEEIVDEPGHLDECNFGYLIADDDGDPIYDTLCICDRLRACEARVRDEMPASGADATWYLLGQRKGRTEALDAARDAVAAVHVWNEGQVAIRVEALAAIDALRGTE